MSVAALLASLSSWIRCLRAGEEIVVAERGMPVALLAPIDPAPRLAKLVLGGVLSKPDRLHRPRASTVERAKASGLVLELVVEPRLVPEA